MFIVFSVCFWCAFVQITLKSNTDQILKIRQKSKNDRKVLVVELVQDIHENNLLVKFGEDSTIIF